MCLPYGRLCWIYGEVQPLGRLQGAWTRIFTYVFICDGKAWRISLSLQLYINMWLYSGCNETLKSDMLVNKHIRKNHIWHNSYIFVACQMLCMRPGSVAIWYVNAWMLDRCQQAQTTSRPHRSHYKFKTKVQHMSKTQCHSNGTLPASSLTTSDAHVNYII